MKVNKILSIFIAGLAAVSFAACSEDEPMRSIEPGTSASSAGVYFSTAESANVSLELDQNQFSVTLFRDKTGEELTVLLNSRYLTEGQTNPFTVPASVTFPADASSVTAEIGVDFSSIVANVNYELELSISDETGTPYGLSSKILTVVYAPWTEWQRINGYATYTYTQYWSVEDTEVPVYVRQSLVNENIYQYQCGDVDMEGIHPDQQYGMAYGVNYVLEYDKSTGYVTMEPTNTNYLNTNYNEYVYVANLYNYCRDVNPAFAGGAPLSYLAAMSYFDEETGLFTLNQVYYISLGVFGQGEEYLQLPGYTNYSVSVSTNGHYVSESGEETQVFNIFLSDAITSAKYKVVSGSITETEAETLAGTLYDDDAAAAISASGNVSVALEEGDYSIVVAGYDESNTMRAFAYLSFTFTSVTTDPNAGWTSLGYVLYGDDLMTSIFTSLPVTQYYVEIQENDENPGIYRLVNPYKDNCPFFEGGLDQYYTGGNHYIMIDTRDPNGVFLYETELNMVLNGDPLYASSMAYNNMLGGATLEQVKAAGMCGTLANGQITMPTRQLVIWSGDNGGWYANTHGGFLIDFNGEEEEAAASLKLAKVKAADMSKAMINSERINLSRTRIPRESKMLDSETWSKYVSRHLKSTMIR